MRGWQEKAPPTEPQQRPETGVGKRECQPHRGVPPGGWWESVLRPLRHIQGAPEVEAARPHPQSIQGGWFVWPRSKLAGGGSYSSIGAGAIYRLQYRASPAAGSAVPAPIPSGQLPWEPLPPSLVAGGSWPSKRAHMTHIPPYLHTHTP